LGFRSHGLTPHGSNAIIPPALIIQFRIWSLVGLLNQTRSEHTVQAAVERAWTETEGTIRVVTHVAHDGVTMPFAIRERQQDVKHRWRQRQHRIGARTSSHQYIRDGYIGGIRTLRQGRICLRYVAINGEG